MTKINEEQLQMFEDQTIRSAWDEENEEWYFSIVDVVGVLTESVDGRKYWNKLKQRLREEGNETVTNCHQLKMKAADGKRRLTDVANTEQLLRIIQSIPSKKAEPFKMWLAQVGRERMEETMDPELIVDRLVSTYERKGYTKEWINQRLQAISARKELTDEWKSRGITSGKQYATKEISQVTKPEGFEQSKSVANRGGKIAGNARRELEEELGRSVITSKNANQLNHVVEAMLETSVSISEEKNNDYRNTKINT